MRDHGALPFGDEVDRAAIERGGLGAGRNPDQNVLAAGAVAVLALAVAAALATEMSLAAEPGEVAQRAVTNEDDVSAVTPVASVGTSLWDVRLAAEADDAVATRPALDVNSRSVVHAADRLTARRMFLSLDFIYMPSPDAAADARHFQEVLGAEHVFSIEAFGTRVAMMTLGQGSPALLFAEHLEGERPVLVYRVEDLDAAAAELREQGAEVGDEFGIPHGPIRDVKTPGGNLVAMYELTRPGRAEEIKGRRDF